MSEVGRFRPVYSRDDIRHLQDLLLEASPQSTKTNTPEAKLQKAILQRRIYELVSHANVVISAWDQLRDGKLDRQITTLNGLDVFTRGLGKLRSQVTEQFEAVLEEYGPSLKSDTVSVIDRLEAAVAFYKRRHEPTPGNIESEGKARSRNLAGAQLEEFLTVAIVTWCQATGKPPTLSKTEETGETSGDCSRFLSSAALPFIARLNATGHVVNGKWSALYKRLCALRKEMLPDLIEVFPSIAFKSAIAKKRKPKQVVRSR